MISAVTEEQAAAFALLRRSQTAADLLPQDRWERYQTGVIAKCGLNPALARRAETPLGNLWVIPGDGWMCVSLAASSGAASLDGGGLACSATKKAIASGIVTWTSSESGKDTLVQGVVPDGIAEIMLTAADGSTASVGVSDNAFGAVLRCALSSVCVAGEIVLHLGVPAP